MTTENKTATAVAKPKTSGAKKTTTRRRNTKKANALMEQMLDVPEFANNEYKTYYVETMKRNKELNKLEKRVRRKNKVANLMLLFDSALLIGLLWATFYACETIRSL